MHWCTYSRAFRHRRGINEIPFTACWVVVWRKQVLFWPTANNGFNRDNSADLAFTTGSWVTEALGHPSTIDENMGTDTLAMQRCDDIATNDTVHHSVKQINLPVMVEFTRYENATELILCKVYGFVRHQNRRCRHPRLKSLKNAFFQASR